MELNHLVVPGEPRPSASIALLRDGAAGLEVFLLKRHGASDVLGGAYVFAGGKVDQADSEIDTDRHLDQTPGTLASQLGELGLPDAVAASLFVAGIRELFEETGVLLAEGATTVTVAGAHDMLRSGYQFAEVLAIMGLRLQATALAPWSRWITPKQPNVSSKRFDTRFFLSTVPPGQTAVHDNHEATESLWLTPRAALMAYWDNRIELAPPQIMGLAQLARYGNVHSAWQAAQATSPPLIAPESFMQDGGRVVCYPGDPRHSISQPVMAGPTRLFYREGRFEPEGGLAALLP